MTTAYSGLVVFEAADEAVYLNVTIDDLDASDWIGLGDLAEPLFGLSAAAPYEIKLVGAEHERQGQTARAHVDCDGDGALRLGGRTPFA